MKEELIDYVKALTNLYGVVSKEKLIEIYNMQNDEQITQKEVDEILTKEVTEEFHRIMEQAQSQASSLGYLVPSQTKA